MNFKHKGFTVLIFSLLLAGGFAFGYYAQHGFHSMMMGNQIWQANTHHMGTMGQHSNSSVHNGMMDYQGMAMNGSHMSWCGNDMMGSDDHGMNGQMQNHHDSEVESGSIR